MSSLIRERGGECKNPPFRRLSTYSGGMAEPSYRIDLSLWPVAMVTIFRRPLDDEFDGFLRELDALLARQQPFALVYDIRRASAANARQRAASAAFIQRHGEATKLCLGLAFLTDNPLVEGAVTAICWLTKPPFPMKCFRDPEEGLLWISRLSHTAGISTAAMLAHVQDRLVPTPTRGSR